MAIYYVNPNPQSGSGDHEVHVTDCYWLTLVNGPVYLGDFLSCWGAVGEARSRGYNANGCYHCSSACHTS